MTKRQLAEASVGGEHGRSGRWSSPPGAIRLSTWPTETVLDPFADTGTTPLVARMLGRRGSGIEVSERYCELAAERLAHGSLDLAF
jgi:hypothetical protein